MGPLDRSRIGRLSGSSRETSRPSACPAWGHDPASKDPARARPGCRQRPARDRRRCPGLPSLGPDLRWSPVVRSLAPGLRRTAQRRVEEEVGHARADPLPASGPPTGLALLRGVGVLVQPGQHAVPAQHDDDRRPRTGTADLHRLRRRHLHAELGRVLLPGDPRPALLRGPLPVPAASRRPPGQPLRDAGPVRARASRERQGDGRPPDHGDHRRRPGW